MKNNSLAYNDDVNFKRGLRNDYFSCVEKNAASLSVGRSVARSIDARHRMRKAKIVDPLSAWQPASRPRWRATPLRTAPTPTVITTDSKQHPGQPFRAFGLVRFVANRLVRRQPERITIPRICHPWGLSLIPLLSTSLEAADRQTNQPTNQELLAHCSLCLPGIKCMNRAVERAAQGDPLLRIRSDVEPTHWLLPLRLSVVTGFSNANPHATSGRLPVSSFYHSHTASLACPSAVSVPSVRLRVPEFPSSLKTFWTRGRHRWGWIEEAETYSQLNCTSKNEVVRTNSIEFCILQRFHCVSRSPCRRPSVGSPACVGALVFLCR